MAAETSLHHDHGIYFVDMLTGIYFGGVIFEMGTFSEVQAVTLGGVAKRFLQHIFFPLLG